MKSRITALVSLAAFLNLTFAGCSKVVKISAEEFVIDTPKRVTGVVLKSGQEVTFDSTGGKYDPSHRQISGESPDGTHLREPLSKLDSVRVVDLARDSLTPLSIRALDLQDYLRPKQNDKIVSVVTRQSVSHKFWSGYRIDPVNNVIFGLTPRDSTLRVPLDSVAYFSVKRPDGIKTMIFVAVTLAASVALAALAVTAALNNADRGDFQN